MFHRWNCYLSFIAYLTRYIIRNHFGEAISFVPYMSRAIRSYDVNGSSLVVSLHKLPQGCFASLWLHQDSSYLSYLQSIPIPKNQKLKTDSLKKLLPLLYLLQVQN